MTKLYSKLIRYINIILVFMRELNIKILLKH